MIHDDSRADTYAVRVNKHKHEQITNNNNDHTNDNDNDDNDNATVKPTTAANVILPWQNIILMISLIFGGCCANVFALEAIIKDQPTAGPLITFAQFILCALLTLPHFLTLNGLSISLKPRAIPLRSWIIYTLYFASVNLLNNRAFAYHISVPLHIILRSGGPVASMLVGYAFNNRRYSKAQVLSVAMLTLGVMGAAMADARAKAGGKLPSSASTSGTAGNGSDNSSIFDTASTNLDTIIGFSLLALAMILSAFQGIYADRLYATYGRDHWKEALFYSHTLSLPLFLSSWNELGVQWAVVKSSPSIGSTLSSYSISAGFASIASIVDQTPILGYAPLSQIPTQIIYLLLNAITQYACIRGVHLLSAKSSSLTVTVALNVRKLVSLLLSVYLFGNELVGGVLVGAVLVFVGGGLYGVEGARLRSVKEKEKGKNEKGEKKN